MSTIFKYESASIAIEQLKNLGFTEDFNLIESEILNKFQNYQVDYVYRYEGESNPDDQSIVYGMHNTLGKKGVYISGYSADSNSELVKLLWKKANDKE